jgi:hypothetical protein
MALVKHKKEKRVICVLVYVDEMSLQFIAPPIIPVHTGYILALNLK